MEEIFGSRNLVDMHIISILFLMLDQNHLVAVGDNGSIFKSSDGGIVWLRKSSGTSNILNFINFSDIYNGIAVGWYGTIF